ncbi:hypothetical protein FHS31_000094 [Sphingomonas vulcanisoli]|uniref:Ice-binding protein C-terminal domain-containing protein n=1 Tax=Sphingomonas vulcanisoli TaxID=1658060 RepID=A0ABX0TLX6_9SPHN|nr:PEPxxWA-CTERM sorting domain-containing protein [Sphingomonas vulcanisoli]NIJ06512.1 hypothetical protein [Sphingomonas vulcanisoli]
MKRILAAVAACLALAGAAGATTYTADFSSITLDPTLTPYAGASYITSGNGNLTFAYRPDEAGTDIAPGVFTNMLFSGDYTATITLDMTNIPTTGPYNYYGAGFCSTVQSSGTGICANSYNNGTPIANGSITTNGVFTGASAVTAANIVTFQLQRIGDVVTDSMSIDGGAYQTLATYSGSGVIGDVSFGIFNVSNAADGATGSVSFSNFSVVSSDVPEPASWGMMICGLGLAGAVMRRKKTVAGSRPCYA